MNRIHIIGAGGPAGVGLTRCLKDHYDVTGEDSSQWAELMMECKHSVYGFGDMDIALPDSLIAKNSFRPPQEQIDLCQDKAKTADVLGRLAPKVFWERDTHGAGGSGAKMCSEYLPGKNYSVEFVYYKGVIRAEFQKMRVSYSVKSRTQGIENRGSSAVSICTDNAQVFEVAAEAIDRLRSHVYGLDGLSTHSVKKDLEPHGFYGVDLKCDSSGVPKVTEINAGRLLTASYAFFHQTRYNLPLVGVEAYLGEKPTPLSDYPVGWGQIRQVGQEPKLFPPEVTKTWI